MFVIFEIFVIGISLIVVVLIIIDMKKLSNGISNNNSTDNDKMKNKHQSLYKELGYKLKKSAKAKGNFVTVDINNVYDLLQSLSYFFYKKHHEWAAICFLNENFVCNQIWFNKGPDHTTVSLELTPKEIIEYGVKYEAKYIIIAHNHPASSKLIPDYKTKFQNIQANKELKRELFNFSDQDSKSANYYGSYLQENGLSFADAVFVAGDYKISGNEKLVNNFTKNN